MPGRPREVRSGVWRGRAALAGVVAGCMTVTVVAVSGAGTDLSGMKFVQSGHMVYNRTLGIVFHVDGGTKSVDGQVPVPGAGPGSRVVQTDESGYVLAEGSTIEFGKSDLKVADPMPAPSGEQPVGLEAAGAAYAIYRQSGQILRLGERPTVVSIEGQLGQPVVTSTGTLWVHGLETGQLCELPLEADRLSCPAKLPTGHVGALTLVGDQAVFVDTTGKELRAVSDDGFGRVMPLTGLDIAPGSIVAPNDVAGRVAILDPRKNVLQLVDPAALTTAKPAEKPIVQQLAAGRYEQLASSGQGLAMIDSSNDTLVTLDRNGRQQESRKIPAPSKQAKTRPGERPGLVRGGDSRLYLDSWAGEHVMVVEGNGQVTEVEAVGPALKPKDTPTPVPPKPSEPVPTVRKPVAPVTPPTSKPVGPVLPPTGKPIEPPRTTRPPSRTEPPPPKPPRTVDPPAPKPTPNPPPTPTPTPTPKPTVRASRPGAPGNVSAQGADAAASVTWSAAAANGAPITSYVVSWAGGSRPLAATARRVTVTGLVNGNSYTFTVRAVNRVGAGPGVSSSRITLGAAAGAPVGLRAVGSSGAVTLSWSRPNLNGGKLSGYGITLDSDPESTSSTTYRWTGLTNGKRYTFQVRAVTTTPDGRLLVGAPATVTTTAGTGGGGAGTITISRGPAYDDDPDVCKPGDCYYIHIMARGLQPNTSYAFQGHTTNYGPLHPGGPEPLQTTPQGTLTINKFYNSDVGGQVWVTATGPGGPFRSNYVDW